MCPQRCTVVAKMSFRKLPLYPAELRDHRQLIQEVRQRAKALLAVSSLSEGVPFPPSKSCQHTGFATPTILLDDATKDCDSAPWGYRLDRRPVGLHPAALSATLLQKSSFGTTAAAARPRWTHAAIRVAR